MKSSIKVLLHPLTLFILGVGCLTGYFKYIVAIYFIVIVHEMGHIIIAKIFKRKVISISLLPFGGLTILEGKVSEDIFEDLLIAAGGILAQIIFGMGIKLFNSWGSLQDGMYNFLRTYNVFIISFNLLPICPLDGYKMARLLCELFTPYKVASKMAVLFSFFFLGILLLFQWGLCSNNIFVIIFLLFMCFEEIRNRKYALVKFYLERMNYDFYYARCDIGKIDAMFKNRVNYIDGEHEKKFLKRYFTSEYN